MCDTIIIVRVTVLKERAYRTTDDIVKTVTSFGKNAEECVSVNCVSTRRDADKHSDNGDWWIAKDSHIDLVFKETPGAFFGMLLTRAAGEPYMMDGARISCTHYSDLMSHNAIFISNLSTT